MSKLRYSLILVVIALGLFPVFFGSRSIFIGLSQINDQKDKTIRQPYRKDEPVEIISVQTDQKNVEVGKPFHVNNDWLQDLSITYRNTTHKNIVSFSLALDFPETKATGNIMAYNLASGTPMDKALRGDRTSLIKPGDTLTLNLSTKEFLWMKKFIETRHSLESLKEVDLRIDFILFDDGTGWTGGGYVMPDPTNPRRFIAKKDGEERP